MKKNLLTQQDKKVLLKLYKTLKEEQEQAKKASAIMTFSQLKKVLGKEGFEVAEKLMGENPKDYGFKGPFLGIKDVPKKLIEIKIQHYTEMGEPKSVVSRYVSKKTYDKFVLLNNEIINKLERPLILVSGYRSPAYQMFIFLYWVVQEKFNLKKVFSRVALPGYSEHGDGERHAIDFMTVYGLPSDARPSDFEKTQEYALIKKLAPKYGFKMTYPRNNKFGVIYEPWHWRQTK